jgi:hypothetical protein
MTLYQLCEVQHKNGTFLLPEFISKLLGPRPPPISSGELSRCYLRIFQRTHFTDQNVFEKLI